MFFHSFVASKARKVSSEKRGGAEDRLPKMSTKFAPRLRTRAIWKSKSLKADSVGALLDVQRGKICTKLARESNFCCMFGALLEVELGKICTTPARESDLEVKIVQKHQVRGTFLEVQSAFRVAGARFNTLQNTRQAQEFVRVTKNVGRRGGFDEGPKRCISRGRRMAGIMDSQNLASTLIKEIHLKVRKSTLIREEVLQLNFLN